MRLSEVRQKIKLGRQFRGRPDRSLELSVENDGAREEQVRISSFIGSSRVISSQTRLFVNQLVNYYLHLSLSNCTVFLCHHLLQILNTEIWTRELRTPHGGLAPLPCSAAEEDVYGGR